MKKQLRYLSVGTLLLSLPLLNACQQQIDEQQPKPESAAVTVPANLQMTDSYESNFVLSESINFDVIKPAGQAPSGRLIRWGIQENQPNYWRTFTYDQTGRLIGSFKEEYGGQTVELARYQGNFLAECFVKDVKQDRIFTLKRYQYDMHGRLSRTLLYASSNDKPTEFRLVYWLLREYDAKGELQKARFQSTDITDSYNVYYWQNGDCVRREYYFAPGGSKIFELRERTDISFASQANPLTNLPFHDEYTTQPSIHYPAGTFTTRYQEGKEISGPGCALTNTFEFDGQNRLSRMRPTNGNAWQYFTYNP